MNASLNREGLLSRKRNDIKSNIVTLVLITVCLLTGRLLFTHKAPIFICGHSLMMVTSASMEPSYPVYCIVVIKKVPFDELKEGDVIAFKSEAIGGALALHRIKGQTLEGVYTKGDNNSLSDNQLITSASYEGKAVLKIALFARYIATVQTIKGRILYLLLPVLLSICIYSAAKTLYTQHQKK